MQCQLSISENSNIQSSQPLSWLGPHYLFPAVQFTLHSKTSIYFLKIEPNHTLSPWKPWMPPYQLKIQSKLLSKVLHSQVPNNSSISFLTTFSTHVLCSRHIQLYVVKVHAFTWKALFSNSPSGKLLHLSGHISSITPSQNLPWLLELSRAHLCVFTTFNTALVFILNYHCLYVHFSHETEYLKWKDLALKAFESSEPGIMLDICAQ